MKIMAVDPGLARIGWAILESDGDSFSLVECGLLQTPKEDNLPKRLSEIHSKVTELISGHKVSSFAVEELFFSKNVKTAIDVAQARGVIIMSAQLMGLPVYEYTPNQVKQAVTSSGSADKLQVGKMVQMLLRLPKIPSPDDVAYACALGLCHLFSLR